MRKSHEELRNNLFTLLGDNAKKQLDQAASEQMFRNAAGELAGRLINTDAPLTAQQADKFVHILANHRASLQRTPNGFLLPNEVKSKLQSELSPTQFSVLELLQLKHEAEREMADLSRKHATSPGVPARK